MKIWYEKGAYINKKARAYCLRTQPEQVKSIAVIRHAALGDMIATRPFLVELRRFFPHASITLSLVSNYQYGAPTELVDRVHITHGSDQRGQYNLKQTIANLRSLGTHDMIIDLAATPRSFYLMRLNKAQLKMGFPYRAFQRRLYYDIALLRSDLSSEAEVMLHFLNILGAKTAYPLDYGWQLDKISDQNDWLYFPHASQKNKCWPDELFTQLIAQQAQQYPQVQHRIMSGSGEHESVDAIYQSLSHLNNVSIVECLPYQQLVNLIAQAQLMISNDTGIRHIAIATDTPTVGIFFHTIPFRYWPRDGKHEVVFNPDGHVPTVAEVSKACAELQQMRQSH